MLRTIVVPALFKKKPLSLPLPEGEEEMVDFGLGDASAAPKGKENGEVEVQWGKEKSVRKRK